MTVYTIGHGTRSAEELVTTLDEAGARTLVDVRRFPGSRRNPQFNQPALAALLGEHRIAYVHAVELGGRLAGEPGAKKFACIRIPAFRSYAARMGTLDWQEALAGVLDEPGLCLMCAETAWQKCHRRLITDLLVARGESVVHLIRPGLSEPHGLSNDAEVRAGRLYLCGHAVA